ncbi:50S ribosomal protein L25/general stress protein Ctc [Nanchangia anserum]|uniref:Large ribosomal subunit protein bL25 n=1 Tax=Nanchangia anserum TaxID=2692125 RepID=A0A8I0GFP3_9ACTO|nr:50S ribosomal protein L25/general stress protein Ctc [Nanchangia anserum]MBD3689982.1 50S ribosomal protein L25/general stress protein Ctc [Nanchangia anserum]QOX82215.1 50S ribosomal protein L25/general stress protein Ctc [Nanchangia anserum]
MAAIALTAELREETGKGAARRARRAGKLPAVIYSSDTETRSLYLPAHETFLIVKDNANALVSLTIGDEKQLALVKAIQRHPVRRDILHVDLLAVSRTEKVDVDVAIEVTGESAPGTIHAQEMFELAVSCPAIEIPESIALSVEGLEEGSVLRVGDLTLPEDVTTDVDPEEVVVSVMIPEEEPEPETEETEGEEEGEPEAEDEDA